MQKCDSCKGHRADHHGVAITGTNCLLANCIESAREGIKKYLEQIIITLSKSTNNLLGADVSPLHLNCSSDRAHNSTSNQKTYQDTGTNFHGTLKNNQDSL